MKAFQQYFHYILLHVKTQKIRQVENEKELCLSKPEIQKIIVLCGRYMWKFLLQSAAYS